MRPRANDALAVLVAASVLAVTGVGLAVQRTDGADGLGDPAGVVLAAPRDAVDLTLTPTGPATRVPGVTELATADEPEVVSPDVQPQPEPTPEAPAEDPSEQDAAPVEPVPVAVEVLAGRTAASLLPNLDTAAVDATAARTGIPPRALAAYVGASLRVGEERPGCELGWVTLAAIGWVESHHGTIGGRMLRADGYPDRPVIGVPLDGGPGVRAIPDTDGGRWDGDDRWDRAVGPMQFIPSTWQRWQVDASGTGTADPQHIDDAALAAARYLCASGGKLTTPEHWYRAIFSYNRSDAYVRSVLNAANHYAARANAG